MCHGTVTLSYYNLLHNPQPRKLGHSLPPLPETLLQILAAMQHTALFLLALLPASPAFRHGGRVVSAPPAVFSGSTALLPLSAPSANTLWPGSPIYQATHPASLSGLLDAASASPTAVHCVVDGRAVLPAARVGSTAEWRCDLSFLSFGSLHSVAMYASGAPGGALPALLGGEATLLRLAAPPGSAAAAQAREQLARSEAALRAATPATTGVLGVYTTTYQQVISQAYQNVSRDFGVLNSMEDVLRNESAYLADSIARYLPNGTIFSGMLSQIPALGPYCYYRKRASEPVGVIPDCPEASHVLNAHADELSAAGACASAHCTGLHARTHTLSLSCTHTPAPSPPGRF